MSEGRVVAIGPVAEIMDRLDLRPMTGRFEAGVVVEGGSCAARPAFQLSAVSIGGRAWSCRASTARWAHACACGFAPVTSRSRPSRPPASAFRTCCPARWPSSAGEEGAFVEVNVDVATARPYRPAHQRAVAVLRLAPGQPVFALVKSIALDRVVRLGADPT